jgi:hypothetical protein
VTDAFGPEEPVRVQPTVMRPATATEAVATIAAREGDVVFTATLKPGLLTRLRHRAHRADCHGVALAS